MLFLINEDSFNPSINNSKNFELKVGGVYYLQDFELVLRNALATLFINSLQSDYSVGIVSRNRNTLISFLVYHKIYRKSKKVTYQNMHANFINENSYVVYPEIGKKHKSRSTASSILLIDAESLNAMDINIKDYINENCINIIYSSKDIDIGIKKLEFELDDLDPSQNTEDDIISSYKQTLGSLSQEFRRKIKVATSEFQKNIINYNDLYTLNKEIRNLGPEQIKKLMNQKL